jgi:hypothetical protein
MEPKPEKLGNTRTAKHFLALLRNKNNRMNSLNLRNNGNDCSHKNIGKHVNHKKY